MSWESIYECALNSGLIKKPLERGFFKKKWSHLESNQAPTDYESVALTEWAIGPSYTAVTECKNSKFFKILDAL